MKTIYARFRIAGMAKMHQEAAIDCLRDHLASLKTVDFAFAGFLEDRAEAQVPRNQETEGAFAGMGDPTAYNSDGTVSRQSVREA